MRLGGLLGLSGPNKRICDFFHPTEPKYHYAEYTAGLQRSASRGGIVGTAAERAAEHTAAAAAGAERRAPVAVGALRRCGKTSRRAGRQLEGGWRRVCATCITKHSKGTVAALCPGVQCAEWELKPKGARPKGSRTVSGSGSGSE